jgi:Lanthionine-containing peptide SapB precursor RamS
MAILEMQGMQARGDYDGHNSALSALCGHSSHSITICL